MHPDRKEFTIENLCKTVAGSVHTRAPGARVAENLRLSVACHWLKQSTVFGVVADDTARRFDPDVTLQRIVVDPYNELRRNSASTCQGQTCQSPLLALHADQRAGCSFPHGAVDGFQPFGRSRR